MRAHVAIFSLCLSQALAWDHVESKEQFELALKNNDQTLVAYIRPDEENSQLLEPEWKTALSSRKDLISVDCSQNPKLCQSQGISSFPTIRLYQHDKPPVRYRGPRTTHSIISFLERVSRPQISYVNNKNVTKFQSIDDIVVIGHLNSKLDEETFTALAQRYSDRFSFALSKPAGPSGSASKIECYNNPDSETHSTTDLSPANLNAFIKTCSTPLIAELTTRNELYYYSTGNSIVHYFPPRSATFSGHYQEYIKAIRPIAQKYKEYLHFVITPTHTFPQALELMGLAERQEEISAAASTSRGGGGGSGGGLLSVQRGQDVFPYLGDEDVRRPEVVEEFLGDIIRGKVKPWTGPGEKKKNKEGGGHDEL